MSQQKIAQNTKTEEEESQQISIHLIWNHRKFTIDCQKGTPYAQLLIILFQKINRHFSQLKLGTEAGNVLGFSHKPQDLSLDYQLSIGNGNIDQSATLVPFLKNNQTGLLRYQVYKCLAVGGFSKVYLVRSRFDGMFYVMKTMSKIKTQNDDQPDLSVIDNERQINTILGQHPFVVKLHDFFETQNFAFFILQYCPGGELFYHLKRVKRMTQEDAKFYFVQILHGFEHLHNNGVLYRDLKPQNILIDAEGHIKLADFGLSKTGMNAETLSYSYCGSAEYMAPEMIMRTGHSFAFDFYTLGALLYQLVIGIPPFYSQDQQMNRYSILNQEVSFPSQIQLSEDLRSLLKSLLNKNPKVRLGCLKGVKQIRCHPWVGLFNPKSILSRKLKPPFVPDLSSLNFDESQIGTDQGQFTNKLKKQIRVLNRSLQTKDKFRFQMLRNNSNFNLKGNADYKNYSNLSHNISPYLQKMSLLSHSTNKLKIFHNDHHHDSLIEQREEAHTIKDEVKTYMPSLYKIKHSRNSKFPQISCSINKQNKTAEYKKLAQVYISDMNSKKYPSPPRKPLINLNTVAAKISNKGNSNAKKQRIQIIASDFQKSSSAWK